MTELSVQGTFSIIGYIIGVVGAVVIVFSRVKNENLKDLKDRVDILEKERDDAKTQHIENQKAISLLQGKLDSYKEIPLKRIDESLAIIAQSNKNIEQILTSSAVITKTEADSGGLLVHTQEPLNINVKEKK